MDKWYFNTICDRNCNDPVANRQHPFYLIDAYLSLSELWQSIFKWWEINFDVFLDKSIIYNKFIHRLKHENLDIIVILGHDLSKLMFQYLI